MINATKKFNRIMKQLYLESYGLYYDRYELDDVMESNESRLNFLNEIFERVNQRDLPDTCRDLFEKNIKFLHKFMAGEYGIELSIPYKYFDDKEDNLIVPTENELEYLFKLIEANKRVFDLKFKGKKFVIDLPNNTFNQNMRRELEVFEYNLAHLFGLTDSEKEPDPNKNLLKKYFIENVPNYKEYGERDSDRLLNWILSEEGKEELKRINRITNDFILEDQKQHANQYNSEGVIKINSLPDFKRRLKNETGLDYPLIKYSRYMTKTINAFNFLNMNNVYQLITDYNAPKGEKDEKDIFIVNCPSYLLSDEIQEYEALNVIIYDIIENDYKGNGEQKNEIKEKLERLGFNFKSEEIREVTNLMYSKAFIDLKSISPKDFERARNSIMENINILFDKNVHLIGFDTNFKRDDKGNVVEIFDLNESSKKTAHCDTSVALSVPELVDKYYERGRPFFIDKIYSTSGSSLLRLSTPNEEINYLRQMLFLEPYNNEKLQTLTDAYERFETNYNMYKEKANNRKK